jgi:hypothetical protein
MGRKEIIEALKKRIKEKLKKPDNLSEPDPPPRYDEIYFEGKKWLDNLK